MVSLAHACSHAGLSWVFINFSRAIATSQINIAIKGMESVCCIEVKLFRRAYY